MTDRLLHNPDVTGRVIEERIRDAVYAWVLANKPEVIVEARRLVTSD